MENRNLGIILTLVTVLLCGIPGLISICSAVILIFSNQNFEVPRLGVLLSLSLLCIGIFFIVIPFAAGLLTYRGRTQSIEPLSKDEPIPPPN
jgi:hypothetical protein